MTRPAKEYASTVWDSVSQRHVQVLEQVQWRATRYMFNNYSGRSPGCMAKMINDLQE